MAVKKNKSGFNTRSGKIFLNEHTILKNIDSQKTKNYYTPITGDIINTEVIQYYNSQFDDSFSIHFNKENISNNTINISTGLTDDLKNLLNSYGYLKLNNYIATPSEISNITIIPDVLNDFEKINKFIGLDQKKPSSRRNYFNPTFNDNSNYNFSNLVKYDFLESDYEYTSIEIELQNPQDIILQHTAKIQENDFNYRSSNTPVSELQKDDLFSFDFNNQTTYERLNTPFVLYNFKWGCFEYRGLMKPNEQFNEIDIPEELVPLNRNDEKILNLPFIEIDNEYSNLDGHNFEEYFNKYFMLQDPLTNTPINFLKTHVDKFHQSFSYLSNPSSQFGFPNHLKFSILDDNILKMSKYINKPFILDMISLNLNVELLGEVEVNNTDLKINNGLSFSLNYGIMSRKKENNIIQNQSIYNPFKLNTTIDTKFYSGNSSPNKPLGLSNISYNHSGLEKITRIINNYDNSYSYENLKLTQSFESINQPFSYHNQIVSSNNITFHSYKDENLNILNPATNLATTLERMKNNCDYFIEINQKNTNDNDYDLNFINCNYLGNINFTTICRKKSYDTSTLNQHNLNYQLELPSFQNLEDEFYTRNNYRYNMLDGRDKFNALSFSNNLSYDVNGIKSSSKFFNNPYAEIVDYPKLYDENYITNNLSYKGNFLNDNFRNYSPYILLPNDEISFYFSISPTISPTLIKQLIKLKEGKIKFTLHGYIPKNNEKIKDFQNMKNLNQENLNSSMLNNEAFVTDHYQSTTDLRSFIGTYFDRIYEGDNFDILNSNTPRKRKIIPYGSKILTSLFYSQNQTSLSFIPYVRFNENINQINRFNYDDFKLDLFSINQKYYNDFQSDDDSGKSIFKNALYNISYSKSSSNNQYISYKNTNYLFFSQRAYGQFSNLIQQRKYTTTFDNQNNVYYVVQQRLLDRLTGVTITDFSNSQILNMNNKSSTLQLIDSKVFSYEDIKNLKHVAFNDIAN